MSSDRVSNVPLDELSDRLRAAGYDPPPYVDQEWIDIRMTRLPPGDRIIITVTGIYKLISGWTATTTGRHVDRAGKPVANTRYGCGGSFYLHHLIEWCIPLNEEERIGYASKTMVATDDGTV